MLLFLLLSACAPDPKDSADPLAEDADGDGVLAEFDCDDTDAAVFPGAPEVCDGDDQDCDGNADDGVLVTFWFDDDGDGYGAGSSTALGCDAPAGMAANQDDCDDGRADVHPGVPEVCNGLDDDCDGAIEPTYGTWYGDGDGDGYGDGATGEATCTPESGRVLDGTDCDDGDAAVSPASDEVCDNLVDDDCDAVTDEGCALVSAGPPDPGGFYWICGPPAPLSGAALLLAIAFAAWRRR